VLGVTVISFFAMRHFYKKKYQQSIEEKITIVTKATIYKIGKHQFTTFLSFKTEPKKFRATRALETKSDLGDLKVGDTILIEYVKECHYIFDFYNLHSNGVDVGHQKEAN